MLIAAGLGCSRCDPAGAKRRPVAIWPILGSMFMFRLVVHEYDVRHTPSLAAPLTTLSYFFLLPNVLSLAVSGHRLQHVLPHGFTTRTGVAFTSSA